MSWFAFLKEREALHYGSEMYKACVIRYLQTQGYHIKTSSSQEGHLEDLIMRKKGERDLCVETKASRVSIFQKRFKTQLLEYFCKWLNLPKNERYKFSIFAHKFSKPESTKEIMTKTAIDKKIIEWFNDREDLEIKQRFTNILLNASNDDILEFFSSVDVYEVTGYHLDHITEEREKSLERSISKNIKRLLHETISRRDPVWKPSENILNFMELTYPSTIWEAESKYKLKKTICEKLKKKGISRIPEFTIPRFEDENPFLRSLDDRLDIFKPYLRTEPYQRPFRTLEDQRKREFLYTHLRRLLWCKGLRRSGVDYFFPYEDLNTEQGEENNPPVKIKGPKGEKVVTRALFKSDGTFNFVEHRAVCIRLEKMDETYGITVLPKFIFTEDGSERITGDHASRISRKYLDPKFTRNLNIRTELRFWNYFLIQRDYVREPDPWFNSFLLKEMRIDRFDWTSKSYSKDQLSLNIFLKEGN